VLKTSKAREDVIDLVATALGRKAPDFMLSKLLPGGRGPIRGGLNGSSIRNRSRSSC